MITRLTTWLEYFCLNSQIWLWDFRWMNIGYEEEELKPFVEPQRDQRDDNRVCKLIQVRESFTFYFWVIDSTLRDSSWKCDDSMFQHVHNNNGHLRFWSGCHWSQLNLQPLLSYNFLLKLLNYKVIFIKVVELLIDLLFQLGYRKENVLESLDKERFDDVHATYLLLGERKSDVIYFDYRLIFCYRLLQLSYW